MHASSPKTSKGLTGQAQYFDEFERGYDNLEARGIVPAINNTLSVYTIPLVGEMLDWAISHRVKHVLFNLGAPAVSQTKINSDFTIFPIDLAKYVLEIYHQAQQLGLRISCLFTIPFCTLAEEDLQELLTARILDFGCQVRNGSSLVFNVSGDLVTCNHLLDYPVYVFEDVQQIAQRAELPNLWQNGVAKMITDAACIYRSVKCKSCKYWDMCGGGCPIMWTKYNPTDVIQDFQGKEVSKP
jgi:radical SAM protein with 4Fe4S-binding SPASM domain